MGNLCMKCKSRPKWNKERGLCNPCYQQWRRRRIKQAGNLLVEAPRYDSEIDFIKNFFTHNNWLYHPAIFKINGFRYEPDFYDKERNVFIEVAGTKQAFHTNLERYRQFIKACPKINFEVRHSTGELIPINEGERAVFHIPEKR